MAPTEQSPVMLERAKEGLYLFDDLSHWLPFVEPLGAVAFNAGSVAHLVTDKELAEITKCFSVFEAPGPDEVKSS